MHFYEIMLANGDKISYKTDISFEEFKKYISKNEWIKTEWSNKPINAFYQTKNIVYIYWDKEKEEYIKEYQKKLEEQKVLKEEVLKYKPNLRIKWKYRRDFSLPWYDEDDNTLYVDGYLEKLLEDCKRCKCKKVRE